MVAVLIMYTAITLKYKTMYAVVTNDGDMLYVSDSELKEQYVEYIKNTSSKNIDEIIIDIETDYEVVLVSKDRKTNDEEYVEYLAQNTQVVYKYYEILLNNTVVEKVDTLEDSEIVINTAKEVIEAEELEDIDLIIVEKFTLDEFEVNTNTLEVAKQEIVENFKSIYEEQKGEEEEEIRVASLPEINGVKLTTTPVIGTITSRYGEYSRLRVSLHTGLDIAAPTGTDILAVADGTVTFAAYNGSYGNKVVIDHGNGVETLYAHTSKMYVTVGQKVEAGDVIAAVGSTGNSTGAHLHLEIIKDGVTLDPQDYLYN